MSVENPVGTVGDVLGSAGVPMTITYEGKQHPVSPPTLRVLDRVEKLVARLAVDSITKLADILAPVDYAARMAALQDKLETNAYGTMQPLWLATVRTAGGLSAIYWACLQEARESAPDKKALPPEIPFDKMATLLRESPDAATVFVMVVPNFFEAAFEKAELPVAQTQPLILTIRDGIRKQLAKIQSQPISSPT